MIDLRAALFKTTINLIYRICLNKLNIMTMFEIRENYQ